MPAIRLPFFVLFLIVSALLQPACAEPDPPRPPAPAPGETFRTVTEDGAWCWFQDPRAVTHVGRHRRVYVGWVTRRNKGQVRVAALDCEKGTSRVATLATLHRDDHANPALHFLPDGRLVVFYSAHNGREMYYRVSERPEDISAWGPQRSIDVNTSGTGYTYPNPVQLSEEQGRIYLFWRGGTRQPAWSVTTDLEHWTPARELFTAGRAPYLKVASNGKDTIHFAFTNDHPEFDSLNNIYYMRYRDGELERADGSRIARLEETPVRLADADLVYDAASGDGRAWIWDVSVDTKGRPILVFTVTTRPDHDRRYGRQGEPGWNHVYHYARWNGRRWQVHRITDGGSWFPQTPVGREEPDPYYAGGISIDPNDPSTVYLSRQVEGVFEIEQWRTSDGGMTWTSRPVTAGSSRLNVRPVVPLGPRCDGAPVLWMHGDYVSYTKYATGIKAAVPAP